MSKDVWIKTGSFVTPASGTTVLDVTSKGTNPKGVVFWGTFNTADQTTQIHAHMGLGFSDGTNHASIIHNAQNAVANTRRDHDNAASFFLSDPTDDTLDVIFTAAMNVNDVTLSYSAFAAGHIVHFMIFGGADCQAFVGATGSAAATNSPVTGVGFTSDLILAHTHGSTANAAAEFAYQSFGVAHDNGVTIDQWALFGYMGNNDVSPRGSVLNSVNGIVGQLNLDFVDWQAEILTITADGFTFDNQAGGDGGTDIWSFLCLSFDGHPVDVGTFLKATGQPGPITQVLPAFTITPQAYWLSSSHETATAIDTANSTRESHGAYDGVDQHSALIHADDGGSTDVHSRSNASELLELTNNLNSEGVTASATAQAILDTAAPEIEWNPNDSEAVHIGFFALGRVVHIDADAGTYAHTGQDVTFRFTMPVDAGVYSFVGQVVTFRFTMPVDAGVYSFVGQDVTFRFTMPVDAGVYSFVGQDVEFIEAHVLEANAGVYSFVGQDVTLRFTMPVDAGVYSFVGQDVTFRFTMPVDAGVYSFVGQDIATTHDRVVMADAGVYSFVGQDVTFRFAMPVDAGVYTWVGQDITTSKATVVMVDAGVFSFVGQDIATTHNQVVMVDAGVYSLDGQDITTLLDHVLIVDAGVYSLVGQDITTTKRLRQTLFGGDYFWTGADVLLSFIMPVGAGVYTLDGQDVTTTVAAVKLAQAGSFAHVGQDVTLRFTMPVDAGVYTFDGQDIDTAVAVILVADGGVYVHAGEDVTFRITMPVDGGVYAWVGQDVLTFTGEFTFIDVELDVELGQSLALDTTIDNVSLDTETSPSTS